MPQACMRGVPTRGEKLESERGVVAGCERGVIAMRSELPAIDRGVPVADSAVRGVHATGAPAEPVAVRDALAADERGMRSTLEEEPSI